MKGDSPMSPDQGAYLIRSDRGGYWNGREWVQDMRKAEVYYNSRDVYYALLLMRSDETRSIANIVAIPSASEILPERA